MLGVCLGHQSLVQAYGGTVVQGEPIHGKYAEIEHDGRTIYEGLPSPLTVGRYHSLIAGRNARRARSHLDLRRHRHGGEAPRVPAEGVQFHPESVLTPAGSRWSRSSSVSNTNLTTRRKTLPNEILTRAIDAVASGNHLTTDHAAAVLSEIMEGRASEVQTGAFLIALRTKGETVPELVGLARTMRELATPVEREAGRPGRHRRHRWRPFDLQRLDHGRDRRRRRGLRGRQARQPFEHEQVRLGRPARSPRREHRTHARTGRRSRSTKSASASCSRPGTTRRWPT